MIAKNTAGVISSTTEAALEHIKDINYLIAPIYILNLPKAVVDHKSHD